MKKVWLVVFSLVAPLVLAQAPPAKTGLATKPKGVEPVAGYVVMVEVKALAPEMKVAEKGAPEAQALLQTLRNQAQVVNRVYLAQDLLRQEVVSTDFILPAGTLLLHKAGDKFYAVADPKTKTYLVMDAEQLLTAIEGGAGIANSQYDAKVQHTQDKKVIAGFNCRKSIVTVSYVSAIPFENDKVLVQQKNDIEVWHTPSLTSQAAMDHFFFRFQRDKTGTVQKVLATEIGFPMEMNLVVTQGAGAKKPASAQPGSLHMLVTEVKQEKALDSELFRIPPTGYTRTEKNPYFKAGSLSNTGAKLAGESSNP